MFAKGLINSGRLLARTSSNPPDGSVYFGGTFLAGFLSRRCPNLIADGKPLFTLTKTRSRTCRNLDYLRSMYDGKIYIPTDEIAEIFS